MEQKKRLGRGLKALMKSSADIISCGINLIDSNRDQPRKHFDENRLRELASSIKQYGLLQPIVVRRVGRRFRIIAGERRYRAAKMAGLKTIKASVFEGEQEYHVSLIENLQREDLTPVEVAQGYRELMEQCDYTQQQLSEKIGKSRSEISNYLRLLKLSNTVRALLTEKKITMGQARPLTVLSHEEQDIVAERIINEKLSARQVEQLTGKKPARRSALSSSVRLRSLEKDISSSLPADIRIRKRKDDVSITLTFSEDDSFHDFVNSLTEKSEK